MSLRLLIFVPSHTDAVSIHHELTTRLAKCLATMASVRLVTSSDKEVLSHLADYDILHIFGCWSHSACKIGAKAYREHLPYVVTPLGGLQPWEMEHHNYSVLARKQQTLIRRAAAIQVCGKLEEQTFAKLEWNHRTALIKNPVLTSQTTFEKVSESLLLLYRKVIDSNVRLLLSESVRKVIGQLLQIGIDPHANDLGNTASLQENILKMTEEDWRKMLIYADDEHITEPLLQAIDSLQLSDNVIDVHNIDRFDRERGYAEGHLKNDALLSRSLLLRNKVKEVFEEHQKTEQAVCLAFLNYHYELSRRKAPLLHLADIYTTLRFTDMDEDAVKEMLQRLKIDDFAACLMSVLEDFLGITEGFMPFADKDGRATRSLYKAITKFGMYN